MKNYGLQLKEIPIIFRGGIEAGSPGGDPIEKVCTNVGGITVFGDICAFTADDEDLTVYEAAEEINIEAIRITIDNGDTIEYENPPHGEIEQDGDTGYYWGSLPDPGTGDFTDPDYPFCLIIGVNRNYDDPITSYSLFASVNPDPKKNVKSGFDAYADFAFIGTIGGGDPVPATKTMQFELTGNGSINRFYVRFAVGENGTLHINPYVILNGNIRVDLCNFADGGFKYINGDDETISFDCYVPVETHALACIDVENVGEYPSIIDAAMVVQYEDFIEPESIVGYEGINLRRGRL